MKSLTLRRNRIRICLFSVLLSLLPAVAQAQFTFTTNNNAIIITKYNTFGGGNIIVPSMTNGYPVTQIADNAFGSLPKLFSISIPSSITNIGNSVFFADFTLTNISVDVSNLSYSSSDGVLLGKQPTTVIQCPMGKRGRFAIPSCVTNILPDAFFDCSLNNIYFPASLKAIGSGIFSGCSALTNLDFPMGLRSIGSNAFDYCSGLSSLVISDTITNLGSGAFKYCYGLTNLIVGNGIRRIADLAFAYCVSLKNVRLGTNVTSIGDSAFASTDLRSITIPDSVTNI